MNQAAQPPTRTGAEAIYHITPESEFRKGVRGQSYVPANLAADGFVHCATQRSTLAVADDYFCDATEPLLLLRIDPLRLKVKVVVEAAAPLPTGGRSHLERESQFPHVYGPIDLDAITGVARLRKRAGRFVWPARFTRMKRTSG